MGSMWIPYVEINMTFVMHNPDGNALQQRTTVNNF